MMRRRCRCACFLCVTAAVLMLSAPLAPHASLGMLGARALAAEAAPYLTPAQVDLLRLLPPPASMDSERTRAELQELLDAQGARTPERAALAVADAEETVFAMFGRVLGPAFAPGAMPAATRLFERIGETEETVVGPAKAGFGRPRPDMVSPDVKPIVPRSSSGAYPSGHATRVTVAAMVLASMAPERGPQIWARAQEYAESRLWGGVHILSDVEAGQRAGSAIAAVLMNDAAFQAEYGPARAEVRRALGLEG